jgi:hypothetical protein
MSDQKLQLLKVLVGSHAHGLADENSDRDYRAVYILPTSDIVSLGFKYKGNDWIEGDEDNTAYELGHFLHLALNCNPTILEVFRAPVIEETAWGVRLRTLFEYCIDPNQAFNAFVGYGLNQRKKFLDKKDNRQNKYACAYIRTLHNLIDLLYTGTFETRITDESVLKKLRAYRAGNYTPGEVINEAEQLTERAKTILPNCKLHQNKDVINRFLVDARRKYWDL